MATNASLTITVTIPQASVGAALNSDATARTIAKEALDQIAQAICDPRQASGATTHLFDYADGRVNTGSWTWTPPAP